MNLSKLPLRHTDYAGRISLLQQSGLFTGDVETGFHLAGSTSMLELAGLTDNPIENFIGFMPVPVGLATNFVVNGRELLVPIASEERGIVAACSKAAKLCRPAGFAVSTSDSSTMTGQVMFSGFDSHETAYRAVKQLREKGGFLLNEAYNKTPLQMRFDKLVNSTCNITTRPDGSRHRVVLNLVFETGESMGAGQVTRLTERAAKLLQPLTQARRTAAICSNRDAGWMVVAQAFWPYEVIGSVTAEAIFDMYAWADEDPRRTITHNKGILNAMEGVALATGQDYRAIGAAAWASAHKLHHLEPLTEFCFVEQALKGTISVRVPVGMFGGATEGPFAKAFRQLTGATTARELAGVIAAAGLAANFGALHCLVNEGLSAGHARTKQD